MSRWALTETFNVVKPWEEKSNIALNNADKAAPDEEEILAAPRDWL